MTIRLRLSSTLAVGLASLALTLDTSLWAAPGDENWDNRFGITQPTSSPNGFARPAAINALAVDGTNTYVGGNFTNIGGLDANYIARWDGRQWHSLGSGMDAEVFAITVKDGIVYAGGGFTNADGVTVNGVARWDGTNWSALGSGMSVSSQSGVNTLAFLGNDLYAGGNFITADGQTANGFARWDGTGWHSYMTFQSLGWTNIGVGIVNALTVLNGQLYIGGSFRCLVGNGSSSFTITNLAVFNGSGFGSVGSPPLSGAYPFGSAMSDIFTLATDGTHLFAGGSFDHAGGLSVNNVAEWDGATWSALGSGINATVGTLLVSGGQIYANSLAGLLQWTGSQWITNGVFSGGFGTSRWGALVSDGQGGLLAAGCFTSVNGFTINGIGRYANGQWTALGLGLNGSAAWGEAAASDGTQVYVGGRFYSAGGVGGTDDTGASGSIVQWDGTSYHSIGTADSDVLALAFWNGNLYAGGTFSSVNAVAAHDHIARWDGTNWHALVSGTSGFTYQVNALLVAGTNLYVGGDFQSIGGITAHGIASWDGAAWHNVGPAQSLFYGKVNALAWYNTRLVAGGNFSFNAPGNSVAQWNGASWSGLSSGVSAGSGYQVNALTVYGTNLIVGGNFIVAGGQAATNLASWNGSAWSSVGNVSGAGLNSVQCLATLNGSLFVGGGFTDIDGVTANGIARWDGAKWSAMGSGIGTGSAYPSAMIPVGNDLFVVGEFSSAGAAPAAGIALWHGSASVPAPQVSVLLSGNQVLLSWPTSAAGYILESSTNLLSDTWTVVTTTPSISGDEYVVTNAASRTAGFFRLQK